MAGEQIITDIVYLALIIAFAYMAWLYLKKEFGDRIKPDKSWLDKLKGE